MWPTRRIVGWRASRSAHAGLVPSVGSVSGEASFSSASAHAAACVRLQTRERRTRHAGSTTLSRAQEYHAHGALHRAIARLVQDVLEGLNRPWRFTIHEGNLVGPSHCLYLWTNSAETKRRRALWLCGGSPAASTSNRSRCLWVINAIHAKSDKSGATAKVPAKVGHCAGRPLRGETLAVLTEDTEIRSLFAMNGLTLFSVQNLR